MRGFALLAIGPPTPNSLLAKNPRPRRNASDWSPLTCTSLISRESRHATRPSPSNAEPLFYNDRMASAPPERVKSARLVGRPQRERARIDRSASVPRARSAGALLRGSSGVPDFYTTSAAGPNPALITHMKMFSRRAEEARRRGRGGKVSIHDLRIEASRPPVHTPRNNPQPGAVMRRRCEMGDLGEGWRIFVRRRLLRGKCRVAAAEQENGMGLWNVTSK